MHGIKIKAGVNNCYWNVKDKYTNQYITRNKIPYYYSRDWNSTQNCTYMFGI